MGRIAVSVEAFNPAQKTPVRIDALVDIGASYLTLPLAWKERFGRFDWEEEVELQTATQEVVKGTMCSPVRITVEGFRPIGAEVLFMKMTPPENGEYEPLLGYIPLESCGAAVDMIGHRLLSVKYMDLKKINLTMPAGTGERG